jgi:RNA polymerase sigma-70 factor (ECF subfamily)
MTDEALMLAYQKGDRTAFNELVNRHERRLWNFLRRFVQDASIAEDLLQEVFLRMVQSAPDWKPTAKFSTWLYTIARNLCTDEARRGIHRRLFSLDTPVLPKDESGPRRIETIAIPYPDVERQVLNQEIARCIEQAIATLPGEQREVFLLREIMDLSFAEIAEATHTNEPTVKSRMRYALLRLRSVLGEFYEKHHLAAGIS